MPTESIQFAPANRPLVQAGEQKEVANAGAQQSSSAAVLGGPSVKVSVNGTQLDKLVAKVKGETDDARLATAKLRIAVVLTVLKALNVQITENQKNALAQIEVLQGQLDELTDLLKEKETGKSSSEARVAALEVQIEALKTAVENAIKDGEEHRKQVAELKKTRSADDAKVQAAEAALAKSEAALAALRESLSKARTELDAAKGSVESAKQDIADIKSQISGIEKKISDCAAAVGDKALASIAAALRADAADGAAPEPRESQSDRDKAEAKAIANDPLNIIRESLDRMDEDVRRTVEDNRTLLV
ncbi:MAG: hypothetical protein II839_06520 [Kiritimatiellae bacterium]|nr:hypothetical protein [Kiritimatiellia bacterium]